MFIWLFYEVLIYCNDMYFCAKLRKDSFHHHHHLYIYIYIYIYMCILAELSPKTVKTAHEQYSEYNCDISQNCDASQYYDTSVL